MTRKMTAPDLSEIQRQVRFQKIRPMFSGLDQIAATVALAALEAEDFGTLNKAEYREALQEHFPEYRAGYALYNADIQLKVSRKLGGIYVPTNVWEAFIVCAPPDQHDTLKALARDVCAAAGRPEVADSVVKKLEDYWTPRPVLDLTDVHDDDCVSAFRGLPVEVDDSQPAQFRPFQPTEALRHIFPREVVQEPKPEKPNGAINPLIVLTFLNNLLRPKNRKEPDCARGILDLATRLRGLDEVSAVNIAHCAGGAWETDRLLNQDLPMACAWAATQNDPGASEQTIDALRVAIRARTVLWMDGPYYLGSNAVAPDVQIEGMINQLSEYGEKDPEETSLSVMLQEELGRARDAMKRHEIQVAAEPA